MLVANDSIQPRPSIVRPTIGRTELSRKDHNSGGEFEREPVPDSALLGSGKFWGMYAGEHTAGTEFMIGPLFLGGGCESCRI